MDDAEETAAVRALAAALHLPGLVDVHTHFMPRSVLEKVWAYFDSAGPLVGRPWPIRYRHAEDERVQQLRDLGVLAFTSMLYPHKPGMAEWLNAWATDFAARTPDCLHTATFFPEDGVVDYVTAALEGGARVFKAHVQVGDYDPTDPLLDPVWGTLSDAGVPTVIHCGSGPAPGRFTGPAPIRRVLARHPRLPLIIAHMGMPEYDDFLDLAVEHDRVHLDTTMSFTPFIDEMMPMAPESISRLPDLGDRILFGSDFPNIPHPYLVAVESVLALGLGDDWNRAVLHDNAVRLFALDLAAR
ncbi:amidohydrolase family protein [Intrasporangium sp.]|uniref:amidohydrolase family protein n=1 Tax=Intrasporangium sp. TaxID=1925024 RepID=UPI002939CF9E|nr:amidohydrolase family protein [Intrasporangium sp.]MDV3219831.1 amidohydrolase [Intrasporangium sp.]